MHTFKAIDILVILNPNTSLQHSSITTLWTQYDHTINMPHLQESPPHSSSKRMAKETSSNNTKTKSTNIPNIPRKSIIHDSKLSLFAHSKLYNLTIDIQEKPHYAMDRCTLMWVQQAPTSGAHHWKRGPRRDSHPTRPNYTKGQIHYRSETTKLYPCYHIRDIQSLKDR